MLNRHSVNVPSQYCPLCWVLWSSLTALTAPERWNQPRHPHFPSISFIITPVLCIELYKNHIAKGCIWWTFLSGFHVRRDSSRLQHIFDLWIVFCIFFLFVACHASCQTCVGPEPSHCTQCRKPEAGLQAEQLSGAHIPSGECLAQCRAQFYLESSGLCEGE